MNFVIPKNIPSRAQRPTIHTPTVELTWAEWFRIQAESQEGLCVHKIKRYIPIRDGLVGLTTKKPAPSVRIPKHFSEAMLDVAPPEPKHLLVASALIHKGERYEPKHDPNIDPEAAAGAPLEYWFMISIVAMVKEPKTPCLTVGVTPDVWIATPTEQELIAAAGVQPSPRPQTVSPEQVQKLGPIKALTIIQPFAELISMREKLVENRTWYTAHRGPLAMHAGKGQSYAGQSVDQLARAYDINPKTLVYGAIIAIADLIDCIKLESARKLSDTHPLGWVKNHKHANGPYCWVLGNIKPLSQPIYTRGAQGLWEWNREQV
jgi:hypothetical protein